ncbi:MAG: sterol desaturase family protein [bacterium]|nr:sterol desaturase family protein [bacterium]
MSFADLMLEHGEDLQYAIFFGAFALFAVFEFWIPRRATSPNRRRRWPTNLSMTVVNIFALGFVPVSFIGAATWAEREAFGLMNVFKIPIEFLLPLAMLLRGLISTVTHLLAHKLPWLWRIHRVHHLDTELDFTSTLRFHPAEFFVNALIGVPVVLALGFPAWVLAFYELFDVAITMFSHANIRLPLWVDRALHYVIVTPDLHRIHHSTWQPETDSNYGAVFPIWDVIFGTFRGTSRARQEDMPLGLEELRDPEAQHLFRLLLSPFRKCLGPAGPSASKASSVSYGALESEKLA